MFFVVNTYLEICFSVRPNLYGIGRPASNQYTGLPRRARREFARARRRSATLGCERDACQRSDVLASIVIPFSARLGKLKCRNSWGNIGFLPKKNILLRHCNDAPDIMEYFQSIIDRGASPKMAVIVNLPATCPLAWRTFPVPCHLIRTIILHICFTKS